MPHVWLEDLRMQKFFHVKYIMNCSPSELIGLMTRYIAVDIFL